MLNQDTTLLKYISYLLYKIITPKVREMPETGNCDYWCRLSWQQAGFLKWGGKSRNLCQWLPNSKWNLLHCWGKSSLETVVGTSTFDGNRSHISSRSTIMDLSTHHQAVFTWVLVGLDNFSGLVWLCLPWNCSLTQILQWWKPSLFI